MTPHDDPHWIDNLTDEEVCHRLRACLETLLPLEIDGITLDQPAEILSYVSPRSEEFTEEERLAWERGRSQAYLPLGARPVIQPRKRATVARKISLPPGNKY